MGSIISTSSVPVEEASSPVEDNTSVACRDFTIFPKLPLELKDMIWTFALPDPRIVSVQSYPSTNGTTQDERPVMQVSAKAIATVLLHTCRRSRQIALGRYKPTFESQLECPIYFDWERDTLYMKGVTTFKAFIGGWRPISIIAPPRDLEVMRTHFRHIAIFQVPTSYHVQMVMFQQFSDLPKLSTVTWVWPPPDDTWSMQKAYRFIQEHQIKARLRVFWKEELGIEDEAAFPKMEFIVIDEWEARIRA